MPKTRQDVISKALRQLGVLGQGEVASAEDYAQANETLDALFAETNAAQGFFWPWTLDTVSDAAFLPLSYLLASEIAPGYELPGPSRSAAIARLRALQFPDDRPLRGDYDDNGTVTQAEQDAADRAAYY